MSRASRLMLGNFLVVAGGIAVTVFLWLLQSHCSAMEEAGRVLSNQLAVFRHLLEEKGEFRRVEGKLLAGDYVLSGNHSIPDLLLHSFGGSATVFLGDAAVSTSARVPNGTRAIGARLDGGAVESVFMRQERYEGETQVLGVPSLTVCDPIRHRDGEVIGALCVAFKKETITSKIHARESDVLAAGFLIIAGFTVLSGALLREFRRSEERYRTVFETTGTATVILEENGTIALANHEFVRLWGSTKEEVEGKMSWTEFVRSPDLERISEYHRTRRVDPARVPRSHEFRFFPLEAPPRDVLCTVNMVPGTTRSVVSITDLTVLKVAQKELNLTQLSIDHAQACIYRISEGGEIVFANQAASRTLGYSREELLGMSLSDIDPNFTVQEWALRCEELKSQRNLFFESIHRTRDGRFVPTETSLTYIEFDGEGHCFASVRDISERKRANSRLDAEKQVLEKIAAASSLEETLALICKSMEEFSRGGICSVLVHDRKEWGLRHLCGPSLPPGYVPALRRIEIAEGAGSCAAAALRRERVIAGDISADPLWSGCRDLPLRHGLRACWSTPILSAQGEVYGTFAVYYRHEQRPENFELQAASHAVDLCRVAMERKWGEESLRESEERFRQIFQQNEDAILLLRLDDLDLIDANPEAEKMYGYAVEELRRVAPWELIAASDVQTFVRAVAQLETGRGFRLERISQVRKDGSVIAVSMWAKVIQLKNEHVLYCSVRDLTEKERILDEIRSTQARLIHANKMATLGMLISSVGHEINNPNNSIGMSAALLKEIWADMNTLIAKGDDSNLLLGGLPLEEALTTVPGLIEGVMRGSARITAIVQNLRDFVRNERCGTSDSVDIARVVREATLILTHLIHSHTDHFHVDLPEVLPPARGNHQQLEQVIINLLTNAFQSLPDKSCAVHLSARHDPASDSVVVRVADRGRGMDAETLKKITEPFFSTRLDQGGTGLGLFISASIVRAHGGSLEFESEPGRGTTATLKIPAAP